jgi:hypothetical protein
MHIVTHKFLFSYLLQMYYKILFVFEETYQYELRT